MYRQDIPAAAARRLRAASLSSERLEERVERRVEEPRMLRFEDEIVSLRRPQAPRHAVSWRRLRRAVCDGLSEVGAPLSKVIVDVQAGHPGGGGPALESRQPELGAP